MIIIPAIDVLGGECVRLTQGDYALKKVYFKEPAEVAKYYFDNGITRIHIIDLDGARESTPRNLRVVEKIKTQTGLTVQFGGGIKSSESLTSAFNGGVDMAICGSIAAREPESFKKWLELYSGEKIILGADVKNEMISIAGWMEDTQSEVVDFTRQFLNSGLSRIICTDISKDGMLQGPNMGLYEKLKGEFPKLRITVSGGISSLADIEEVEKGGYDSVILGKSIYEGKIKMEELKRWLQNE